MFLERAPGLWTKKLWLSLLARTYKIIGHVNTLCVCSEFLMSGWLRAAVVRCGVRQEMANCLLNIMTSIFFSDFSHISKVPQRINPSKTKICLEVEVFQVVTSCRLFKLLPKFWRDVVHPASGSCDPKGVLRDSYWKRRNYALPELRKLSADKA